MTPQYVVYWSESGTPNAEPFTRDEMPAALDFTEALRKRQRNGEPIRFVSLCSENPDHTGIAGVAPAPPGYEWKKRRI